MSKDCCAADKVIQGALIGLAGIIAAITLLFVFFHTAQSPYPPGYGHNRVTQTISGTSQKHGSGPAAKKKEATPALGEEASAIKDTIGFLVTVSIGLAALAGFAVTDTLNASDLPKAFSLLFLALFGLFLTRAFVYGYDVYGVSAVQLSFGTIFLERINGSIRLMGQSVVLCAIFAGALLVVRVAK